MTKPKSENLFHFTRSIDNLLSILKNGLYPRFCLEDHSWFGMSVTAAYPVVCFCDIPLSRIQEHTDFYGSYGVGLSRDWAVKNQLEPVIYCKGTGAVLEVAEYLYQKGLDPYKEKLDTERFGLFSKLVRYIKPLEGTMIIGGSPVNKDFYQENEWRYAPYDEVNDNIIFSKDFDSRKDEENKKQESNVLKLMPQDIKYIFVPSDAEIPRVVDHVNTELSNFAHADLKILISRIISLDTIKNDI